MIQCPQCGRVSHNPNDEEHRYCGACHQFHDTMSKTEKEPEAGFDISPGKYFDRMVFTAVDEIAMPPHGGDSNALIWRRDGTDDWRMSYRTRRYAGPDSDPFTGGDKKMFTEYKGDLELLRMVADEVTRKCAVLLGGKVLIHDTIKIEGDSKVFSDILVNNPPPWAHAKKIKDGQ